MARILSALFPSSQFAHRLFGVCALTALALSLLDSPAHAWTPASTGTAPGGFSGGLPTSTESGSPKLVGHLPENVPPVQVGTTARGPMNCYVEGNSPFFQARCLYVDWSEYEYGTGEIDPPGEKRHAPKGFDNEGNFREADKWKVLWFEEIGGWRQAAGFGDYINELGQICGCFRALNGCFSPDVNITMADFSQKAVAELAAGDFVWNPITKRAVRVKRIVEGAEDRPLLEIGYSDSQSVEITPNHPVLVRKPASSSVQRVSLREDPSSDTSGFTYKTASEVRLGEEVLGQDGEFHSVTVVRSLPVRRGQTVINFELEAGNSFEEHMVLSDGIVTGDIVAQQRLKH